MREHARRVGCRAPIRTGSSSTGSPRRSQAQLPEPNAMTLATVGPDGRPAARIVLLKRRRRPRLRLLHELRQPQRAASSRAIRRAALLFFWPELERQVRIEGSTAPLDPAESAAYFSGRPRAVAARGVGVAAKRDRSQAEPRSRPASPQIERTLSGTAGAVPCPPPLGRLPPRARSHRVLAGPRARACTIRSAIADRRSTPARGSSTGLRRER